MTTSKPESSRTDSITFYLKLAQQVAMQGTCPRAHVGAVLVHDNRVIALGYNGAARGLPHCESFAGGVGCLLYARGSRENSCYRAVHAEMNALLNAAYGGAPTKESTMYCTHSPCIECYKAMLNAGVVRLNFINEYKDELVTKLGIGNISMHRYADI